MLTIAFPAAAFATNCYVIAPGEGEECLVVDPGIGIEETLREVLTEHRLRPAAVLLTHGHVDHVYSVTPVCGGDTAAYIHSDDRYRLTDPLGSASPGLVGMLEQMAPEIEREEEDAKDAGEFLRSLEETYQQAGQKLKSARDELERARRDMGRAAQQRDVAQQRAEAARQAAGLSQATSGLSVALKAMQDNAARDLAQAESANAKAKLLGKQPAPVAPATPTGAR